MTAYHWRDDVHFERLPDGAVRVFQPSGHFTELFTIPPAEWDSIVHFLARARADAPSSKGLMDG